MKNGDGRLDRPSASFRPAWRFTKVWVLLLFGVSAAWGWLSISRHSSSVILPDGSVLRLRGITYGTNAFIDGPHLPLGLLGKYLPFRNSQFFGRTIYQMFPYFPDPRVGTAPLTAWFQLRGPGQSAQRPFLQFVAGNRDGRQLYCSASPIVRGVSSGGILLSVSVDAFPRDAKEILLYVIGPSSTNGWSDAPAFVLQNPSQVSIPDWKPESAPMTNHQDQFNLVLESVTAATRNFHSAPLTSLATVRFHLESPSNPDLSSTTPPWAIIHCGISDSEGNMRGRENSSRGASEFEFANGLEAGRTWKVHTVLARNRDYSTDELFHLRLCASQSLQVTNSLGDIYRCSFDGGALSVSRAIVWSEEPILKMKSAVDEEGQMVKLSGPTWFEFAGKVSSITWSLNQRCSCVELDLVEPKTITVDFFAKPAIEW